MSTFSFRIELTGLLLVAALHGGAQKGIIISEELAARADRLPVKMVVQWFGKIWKFRFGDYAVVETFFRNPEVAQE